MEEQRQVVGQWKRKVQKLNSETNDLRLLLEEQNARNNLLEKKQRKFDSETQLLQDELRQEKQAKERIAREKEIVLAEKYTLENNLAVSTSTYDIIPLVTLMSCLKYLNRCFINLNNSNYLLCHFIGYPIRIRFTGRKINQFTTGAR